MTDRLIALANGREMGEVRRGRGRLRFAYAAGWREARRAYPLSLSMPLAAAEHGQPLQLEHIPFLPRTQVGRLYDHDPFDLKIDDFQPRIPDNSL